MNTTLQPYIRLELANVSQPIVLVSKGNNLANYTEQLDLIANKVLPMLAKAEARYGNSSAENNKLKEKPLLREFITSNNTTAEHPRGYIYIKQSRLNCMPQMGKANSVAANSPALDNKRLYEARIDSSDINAQDHYGITRLMVTSATSYSIEYITKLLKNGTLINLQDQEGNTALTWALKSLALVSQQYKDKLRYLKKWKRASELWIKSAASTKNMSERARVNSSEASVEALKAASVNAFDELKINIGLFSTQRKDKETLQIIHTLIDKGANIDLTGTGGLSPIMFAVIGNELNLLEKLIKNRANADLQNDAGETALHLAVKYKTCWRIVELLLLYTTDINKKDIQGQTPFMLAVHRGKRDIMTILLAKGVDLNDMDALGWTVLMHAVNCGDLKMVGYLIKRGADVSFVNADSITALTIAQKNKDHKLVELLMAHTPDLSVEKQQQSTLTAQIIQSENSTTKNIDGTVRRQGASNNTAKTQENKVAYKNHHKIEKRHAHERNKNSFYQNLVWHDIIKKHIARLPAINNKVKNPFNDQTRRACLHTVNRVKNIAVSTIELGNNYMAFFDEIGNSSNAQNHDGISDLMMHAATSYSNADFVTPMIKDRGANVNLQDKENNTALMWAVKSLLEMNEEKERNKHHLLKSAREKLDYKDYYLSFRPEEEHPLELHCDDIVCDETACEDSIGEAFASNKLTGRQQDAANKALFNIIDRSIKLDNMHCTNMSCEESYLAVMNSDTSEYKKTPCDNAGRNDDPLHDINCRLEVKKAIVASLLDNGADSDLTGTEGFSPLMMTVIKNDLSAFMQLMASGANIELTNHEGETALHLAIKYSTNQNIINLLIALTKNINAKDNNNQTPFMIASFRGKQDVMELLVQKGVDINQADIKGWTALMHGVNCNNEQVVRYLLDKGVEVNLPTACPESALMIALEKGNKKMAQLLFNAGANINEEERDRLESLTIEDD